MTLRELIEAKREVIEHGLRGEVYMGTDEGGVDYWGKGDAEQIHDDVMDAYNEIAYQLKEINAGAKAMEKILEAKGFKLEDCFKEYVYFRTQAAIEDGISSEDAEVLAEKTIDMLKTHKKGI